MKKLVYLLIVSSLMAIGCYAKCINPSHNVEQKNTAVYNCSVSNTETIDSHAPYAATDTSYNRSYKFRRISVGSATMTVCNNCGCDITTHNSL